MLKQEVADKLTELISLMEGTAKRILDVGTGWAESAEFFSILKPNWQVITVDGFGLYGDGRIYDKWDHEKILSINKKLDDLGVIQILGNSQTIQLNLPVDILFIDADHTYNGCFSDFLNFSVNVVEDGLVVFDDYTQENNPDNGVKKVVKEILKISQRWEMIYEGYYCCILKKI